MSRVLAFFLLVQIGVFAAEPSVYGAGNLNSANPYGLSQSEKKIIQNSKDIKSLQKKLRFLTLQYNNMQEKFDGLRSITESINSKIGKIDKNNFAQKEQSINIKDEISTLQKDLNDSLEMQNTNQEKVKSVLTELSSLIDSINTNYVAKEQFDEIRQKQKDFQEKMEKRFIKLENARKKSTLSSKSGAQLLKEAKKYFAKKSYENAKIRFQRLVKINYKPATSNYMLGEIAYRQKSYKNAIQYYKKSISLYDKASFTPTLLYHTGISLSKLNKNSEARKFFTALKTNYPNSKEAKALSK
ncbi:MAG: tetratricopeptide repeat protein [Campylobacteraceae bacterium]|nr:tetratricopeptide repeat protein [Campylobacteraceae bacterium]